MWKMWRKVFFLKALIKSKTQTQYAPGLAIIKNNAEKKSSIALIITCTDAVYCDLNTIYTITKETV